MRREKCVKGKLGKCNTSKSDILIFILSKAKKILQICYFLILREKKESMLKKSINKKKFLCCKKLCIKIEYLIGIGVTDCYFFT